MSSLKLLHLILVGLLLAIGAAEATEPTQGADLKRGRASAKMKQTDREKLLELKSGTKYEDIVKEFGEPDFFPPTGVFIAVYLLRDGRKIFLGFGAGATNLQAMWVQDRDGEEHFIELKKQ